nr:hypothetical protein [Tanacetum cinerariifolium]
SLSISEILTHWFTLIVLSALRRSDNENMLSLVNPHGFAENIKEEWRYLFLAEPQFITTCSYPTIKTYATLMYSNRKETLRWRCWGSPGWASQPPGWSPAAQLAISAARLARSAALPVLFSS